MSAIGICVIFKIEKKEKSHEEFLGKSGKKRFSEHPRRTASVVH